MHDAWYFIGVFIFIFLVWAATGGPTHPIAFTGPTLAQPGVLGGGTYLSLPKSPFSIGGSQVTLPGSSGGGSVPSSHGSGSSLPSLPGGLAFGEASPYRDIVWLNHSVSGAGSSDPANESVDISVSQNAGVPIDLSGWSLESDASGASARIPQGTEVPTSGIVNPIQDIVLSPGDRATIISGQSPIGASFRENKCIGYFGTFQHFSPSLPGNCPAPSDELLSHYGPDYIRDPSCISYASTLSRCQVILTPPPTLSTACQAFALNYLNYNGCLNAHRTDADFKLSTWRIYLGRSVSMWRPRYEVVKLLDQNGKTVDAFSY